NSDPHTNPATAPSTSPTSSSTIISRLHAGPSVRIGQVALLFPTGGRFNPDGERNAARPSGGHGIPLVPRGPTRSPEARGLPPPPGPGVRAVRGSAAVLRDRART